MSNFPSVGMGCVITDGLHTWIAFNSHATNPLDVNGFTHEPNSNSRWLGVSILQNNKQDITVNDPSQFKWVQLSQVGGGAGGPLPPQSSSYIKFSEFEDGINPTTNLTEFTTQNDKLNYIGIALNIPNSTAPTDAGFYGWYPYNSSSSNELVAIKADLTKLVTEYSNHENSIDNLQVNDTKRASEIVKLTDRVKVLETNKPPVVDDQRINEISARSIVNQTTIGTFQAKIDKAVADADEALVRVDEVETDITEAKRDIEDRINPILTKHDTRITDLESRPIVTTTGSVDLTALTTKVTDLDAKVDAHAKTSLKAFTGAKLHIDDVEKKFDAKTATNATRIEDVNTKLDAHTKLNADAVNKLSTDFTDAVNVYGSKVDVQDAKIAQIELDNVKLNSLIANLKVNAGNLSQAELDALSEQIKALAIKMFSSLDEIKQSIPALSLFSEMESRLDTKLTGELEIMRVTLQALTKPTDIQPLLTALENKLQDEIDQVVASIKKPPAIHVKFSKHPNGRDSLNSIAFLDHTATPESRRFMGIAVGDQEPTLPEDYTWTRAGCDDDRIHIKYSAYPFGKDSMGATMFTDIPQSRKYMGISTSSARKAPEDPSAYTWSQIRGDTPTHVAPLYSYAMYARDNKGTDMSPLPEDRKWIGFVNNWEHDSAPTDYRQYRWVELVGEKGNPGRDGIDGKDGKDGAKGKDGGLQYMFMRFSEYSDGESRPGVPSFTDKPNKFTKYIGWSFNNKSHIAPREADDYFWYTIPKGVKGDTGATGTIHFAYSMNKNGIKPDGTSGYYDDPTQDHFVYLGMRAVGEGAPYVRDDASLYKWMRVKGDAGTLLYTHIGFSNYRSGVDSKGTFSVSLTYTGQRYMLINRNNPSPSFPMRPDAFGTILDLGLMAGTAKGLTKEELQSYLRPTSDKLNTLDTYARAEILTNSNRSIANASLISKVKADLTSLTAVVKPEEIQQKLDSFTARLRITETEVTASNKKADEAKAESSIAFNDTTDLKVDMGLAKAELATFKDTLDRMRIKVGNIEANVNVGNIGGSGSSIDLTPFQDKLNKLETDLSPVITDTTSNKNQLILFGNRIGTNETSITDLRTEIQNLHDVDTSLANTITSVNDSVIRVENRIDNIVNAGGNVDAAELQTVRTELNDLRTKHDADIADVKQTRASKVAVSALRANIGQVSGEMGEVRRENQQMEDRVTRMEITHDRFAPKKFVTDLTDPLLTNYNSLKTTVDTFEVEIKSAKSESASAVLSNQKTNERFDKFEPRVTDCEAKIQTISDDLSALQVTKGISAKDLSDLDTKLSQKVTTLESTIEPKVISIVDKRVSNLSSTTQPANVVALTNRVDALETTIAGYPDLTQLQNRVNSISVGASQSEVDGLKTQMTDLMTKLSAIETQTIEIKYSAKKDGSNPTDSIQADSEFFGIKITKQKLI